MIPTAAPLLAVLSVLASGGVVDESPVDTTWPQWRGPARDGQFAGPAWPDDLSEEHLAVRWRVEGLGPSYSGPVLDEERVYTTETVGQREEVVRAFDRETGEELWRATWSGSLKVPFFAARNGSWIRSTPALRDGALYVAGMRDVLVCLDAATGEQRWGVDFLERFETELPAFGFVSSPLVADGRVFVQAGASFVALDAETGETIWRALVDEGGMNGSAFSSPVLATVAGEEQLLVQTRTELAGVEPDTGAELWRAPIRSFRGMNILTPVPFGDGVFTSTYGGRSQLLSVARGEDGWAVETAWEARPQGYMTTPVVVDGHAYLFLRSNRFTCVDLESGEERWTTEPIRETYWSLAARGDRILALADTGVLRLVRATPAEYDVLAERQLVEDESWAHLAPAGRDLVVRELRAITCFEWR